MGMDMMGGFGWLGMGLMWLWGLLPLALVGGVAWLAARAGRRDRPRPEHEAGTVLRQRLAAGEIDVEQYEKARIALGLPDSGLEGGLSE